MATEGKLHQFESISPPKTTSGSAYDFHFTNEQLVREAQIASQSAQLLREELGECVRKEGVNANVNCYELRKKYFDLLKDRYQGMIFPEGREPANRALPHIVYIPESAQK